MSLMPDQQPLELLRMFHARLARRYGTAGVRLHDFPGRWMVFRTGDLAAGIERAVIDIEAPEPDMVSSLEAFESRASLAVGEGNDATLVVIGLAQQVRVGRDGGEPMTIPILAITAWSLAHPVAIAASIDLDSAGSPRKVNAPFGLLRTGYQAAR
jgi:hypothetical protein